MNRNSFIGISSIIADTVNTTDKLSKKDPNMSQSSVLIDSQQKNKVQGLIKDNRPRGNSYCELLNDNDLHKRNSSTSSMLTDNISLISSLEDENDDSRVHKPGRRSSISNYKYSIQSFLKTQFDSTVEETPDNTFLVYPASFLDTSTQGCIDKNDGTVDYYNHFFGCTSVPLEAESGVQDYFTCCQSAPPTDSYLSSRNKQLKKIDFSRSTKLQRWHIPFEPEWTDWTKEQTIFQSDDDWKNCTTDNSYRFPVNVPKQDINKAASASYSLSPSCSNSSAKYGPMLPERKNSTSSQTIKPKLQSAKQTCNLELRRVIDGLNEYAEHDLLCVKQEVKQSDGDTNQNIYEDVYQPTPFMLTLQNLIGYAQYALDTDLEVLLETKDLCADIVSKIQAVGYQWKLNKNWPCREWYVRLLLSVAALNRAIEWWQAESGVNSTLWKPSAQQEEIVQCQLQEDAKVGQSSTIVMELSLSSPTIQYLSPVWHDVIGTEPQSMIGLNISQLLLARDRNVFEVATNEMLADSRKTAEVLFCVITSDNKRMVEMEGKGMLMHNRVTGESSHTMWVIKQAGETSESVTEKQDLLLPVRLKRTNSPPSYSFELLMNIPPELCRICERWVTAVFFEQHAELCVEIHRAEMDVVDCNDKLTELRHYVQSLSDVTVNEIQDAERNVLTSEDNELIEYSRIELGKYQSLLDVTNTALSLKIPGHVEYDIEPYTCKSKVIEILFWDPPISHDEDIELLILEIQAIVRAKVDATNRMQDRLDYNERIRSNFQQQIASNENWSEFVSPETEKNTIEKVSERNNNLNDSNLSLEILTGTGEKPKEAGESLKKSIFKKIRDWKSKGKKPAIKKLNTTPMVATEIIDTPLSSPKFYNEQTSSSRKSSLSQKVQIAAGKSPCSSSPAASRPTPPSIKDFEIIKPISKGAFGSVFLAKKRITGDYYAIKFLKKSDMIAKNQVTNVKSERMIMIKQTDSPFVAKLYYTFQSKDYLYLVMEYLNGGDCSSLVKVMGSLPYDWARNYLAEVILGLAFLHNKNIIHRDLKPDNLLIDQNGHLKLTDFGLSRMGFLDRRVRDEINHEPLSFSSPFPSRSGTPPRSPSVSSASPSGPLYKNSYFNLLFEQDRHRRGSLASSVSGGEPSSLTSISPFLHEMVNSTSDDGYGVKLHRQRTNSGLLSGRTTPVFSTSEVENTPKRLMVGTPDYLAPESILGTSQDTMVDWWALGVICYEFLFGYPPFHAETPDKVFENILSRSIDWHENEVSLPPEARDFIERLLTSDPEQRLGRNGADEVRNHPFFKDLDWDNLLSEAPSFIPQPMNKEDTDYFDTRGASMMQEDVENLVKEEVKRAKAIIVEQNPDNSFVNQEEEGHEPISSDVDFGTFMYKNLPLLEKANEEAIRKIRSESIAAIATDSSKLPPSSLMAISDRKRNSIIDNMDNQCISTSLPTTPMLAMSPSVSSRTSSFTARKSEDMTNPQLEKVKKSWIEENWDVPKRVRSVSFPNKVFESKPGDGLLENDEEINIMSTPVPTSTHPLDCCGDETAYSYKSTRPLDCLIADDNPISCKILETILKSLHCRCVVVRNGAQAVRCAMGEKVLFDFIFMDIRMPIIDGEAAARMIKSTNNINKTTPIVAFTAYERTFQLSKIFDDVLSKPVTREAVIRCIKHFHDLPIDSNQMAHWPFSLPTIETPPSSFAHTPQEILSPPLTKDKQPHLPYPILPSYILSHLSKEKL